MPSGDDGIFYNMVICVTDSSKIGKKFFYNIAPLSELDKIITDNGASQDFINTIRSQSIDIDVV